MINSFVAASEGTDPETGDSFVFGDRIMVTENINDTGIDEVIDLAARVSDFDDGDQSGTLVDLGAESQILLAGVQAADVQANLDGFFGIA